MKKCELFSFFLFACFFVSLSCSGQKAAGVISLSEVTRVETVLASDSFAGRAVGTPGIEKAAAFIAAEFKKAGLTPLQGNNFLQEFVMLKPQQVNLVASLNGTAVDPKSVVVLTSQEDLRVNENSGYAVAYIRQGESLSAKAMALAKEKQNTLVLVDSSFAPNFLRLNGLKRQLFQSAYNTVFLLQNTLPARFAINAEHRFEKTKLANVVGVLPGKGKPGERVVFSAHYDHLGTGRPLAGDSIYNGANDDAAGTTAVVMLAKYFNKLASNKRTLVFAAFTAEETGGYGSQYFSQQLDPEKVVAMFNIEMIGTESKWGKNSAYITGYDKSSMGTILQASLKGSAFTFYPDPYPQQQLFYRSDNATLARLGVPAHTISTAKMEGEPNYHKPSDEVGTLDLENMTQVIRAIGESSKTIVMGAETPTRVNTGDLR